MQRKGRASHVLSNFPWASITGRVHADYEPLFYNINIIFWIFNFLKPIESLQAFIWMYLLSHHHLSIRLRSMQMTFANCLTFLAVLYKVRMFLSITRIICKVTNIQLLAVVGWLQSKMAICCHSCRWHPFGGWASNQGYGELEIPFFSRVQVNLLSHKNHSRNWRRLIHWPKL